MRSTHLQIKPGAAAPLNPAQRKFNQLVAKIEALRERLALWQRQRPLLAQAHGQRIRPLLRVLHAKRATLAERLDQLLGQPGWTRGQRRTLRSELCEELVGLIEDEDTDDAQAERFKRLHDRHADVDYDTANQGSVQAMRALFEETTGLDLGDGDFGSEDELLRHARQRMEAHDAAEAEQRAARRASRPAKPPTAAQRRREQEEQAAALSLREIYRKLASALHPDRAADEADRAHRTAMMKRVNEANDAKDLLALFALQLEIEQVDAAHIAAASAERARMYNKLLADQASVLQAEIEAMEMSVRLEFLLDPFEPVHPLQLGKLVDREERELRSALVRMDRELAQLSQPASAKRWLQQRREEHKLLERFGDDFGGPF
jgi:hypothetical protein